MDFDRAFVKKWLMGAIGHEMDYKVREYVQKYREKDLLTKEDAAEIDAKIEAQYPTEEIEEITDEA